MTIDADKFIGNPDEIEIKHVKKTKEDKQDDEDENENETDDGEYERE